MNLVKTLASTLALTTLALALPAHADTPAALLAGYSTAAKAAADPARGQQFFTSTHGHEWSCSSCHGALPVKEGKHAATGKVIQPMAPAFNAERFTDSAKTEKWFRRNCNDVVGRECTPGEKADLIAWLLTLKA
jgi:mono/diheme cytochrome c family protein